MRLLVFMMLSGVLLPAYSAMEKDSLNVPFKDRIAIHTNSVGWLLMTPNLGLEYSFVQNDMRKVSALVHGRYNPASLKTYNPEYVYNIGGARAEVRWYSRTRYVSQGELQLDSLERAKYGRFRNFWNKLTTRPYSLSARENPRRHLAFYIGPYLAFDKYTIKLAKTGYQGYAFSVGITAGYSIPLYQYNNGSAIDFEMGLSAGAAMSMNDMFRYNADVECYEYAGSNALRFVPFPVVTDARVAFVYRMNSIRKQLQGIDQEKLDGYAAVYELRKSYDEKMGYFMLPYHYETVVEGNDTVNKKIMHEDYLSSDTIKTLNSVIKAKNERVQAINQLALQSSDADSTMLLEELRLLYGYVEIPEKMFKQYDRMVPNRNVASIKELDNEYLNGLLEKYSVVDRDDVKKETNLGQVEDQLMNSYETLRLKLLEKNDSVSDIRLIDLMVLAVSNVNGRISAFNNKYNTSVSDKAVEFDALPVQMEVITGEAGRGYGLDFVFGLDTLALAESQSYSFRTLNDEIEARNVYRQVLLEDMQKQSLLSKGDADNGKADKKKSKKVKKKETEEGDGKKEKNNIEKSKKEKVKKTKKGKKGNSSSTDMSVGDAGEELAA